jgi:hypothetical protein
MNKDCYQSQAVANITPLVSSTYSYVPWQGERIEI